MLIQSNFKTVISISFFALSAIVYLCVPIIFGINKISGCSSDHYLGDNYIAYCNSKDFGAYEHGAFYYDLEPEVSKQIQEADIIFLGNSRSQIVFSTEAINNYLKNNNLKFYVMGFSYNEGDLFAADLLKKLKAKPKMIVFNNDNFFRSGYSPISNPIIENPIAQMRGYYEKYLWERIHFEVCSHDTKFFFSKFCGNLPTFFRSRETGRWFLSESYGFKGRFKPASFSPGLSVNYKVDSGVAYGRHFFRGLPRIDSRCIVSTLVPSNSKEAYLQYSQDIAKNLNIPFVFPSASDLYLYDNSHLNQESAEEWAKRFIEAADPIIQNCLISGKSSVK